MCVIQLYLSRPGKASGQTQEKYTMAMSIPGRLRIMGLSMAATTPQVLGFLPTPAAHRGPHTQVSGAQPLVLRTLHNLLFESTPVSPLLPLDFFPVLPTPSLLWNCQLVIPALLQENRKEVHYLNVHRVCAGRSQDVFSSHTTALQLGIISRRRGRAQMAYVAGPS